VQGFLEEVFEGSVQIAQGLLKRLRIGIGQPRRFRRTLKQRQLGFKDAGLQACSVLLVVLLFPAKRPSSRPNVGSPRYVPKRDAVQL
jgi:hypothetical protein